MTRTQAGRWLAAALALLSVTCGGRAVEAAEPTAAPSARFLVPAYFYPDGRNWQGMCDFYRSTAPASSIMIMNPDSGPGAARSASYAAAVSYCGQQSQSVVGYVATGYGKLSLATVQADVDAYYRWYGVSGIFFDQMSNDARTAGYYRQLHEYVKAKASRRTPAVVIGNPGVPASTAWQVTAPVSADILVTFEGSAANYLHWTPPQWISGAGASAGTAFAALVYAATGRTTSLTRAVCAAAPSRRTTWIDVTPDVLPNPWDTQPDPQQTGLC